MESNDRSKSGEYWKEHVMSWDASAYYKDTDEKPLFWDRVSTLLRGEGMYVRMEAALRLVAPHIKGLTVLDLGCAVGRFAFRLLEAGAERVIGVDVSPAAIEAANQHRVQSPYADRLEFKVMDLTSASIELPEVDLITALGVIEYFDPPTLSRLLGKFKTRYFLIDFPDSAGRRRNWMIWQLRRVYLFLNRCPGVYLYTQEEFRRIAAQHGFDNVWYTRHAPFDYVTNLPRT
jgi:cyclopropane fatty-acyl-phospholipid synthase-like methyltransferase